ncbi:PIN domain-containing protein [Kribbella sp. HUAS MG21]|uniref:Ribonuclease VapC n=1 Tax=Kribbella sp. HUAS MG21 TaxID=3160966 RepID=A0AAU7TM46_9ACTN
MTSPEPGRRWLIDKSALVRLDAAPNIEQWASRINLGQVRITTLTLLEIGITARSAEEHRLSLRLPSVAAMAVENITIAIERRAVAVQALLAESGQHRAPSPEQLLIAATAELSDLTLLHLDKDLELIADLTGQPTERLAQA